MKDKVMPILFVGGGFVIVCSLISYLAFFNTQAPAQSAPAPVDDSGMTYFFYALGAIGVLIGLDQVAIKIKQNGYGAVAVFLLLMIGLLSVVSILYFVGDKNGDGTKDVQIVRVIQPTGNDVVTDSAYATTNETNSRANVENSVAFLIIMVVVVVLTVMAGALLSLLTRRDY